MSASDPRFAARQQGVGLIEVLIAVLILGIGLLGIAALQAVTLRNAGGAAERSMATIQVYSLLDQLRTDKANAANYNTGNAFACGRYAVKDGAGNSQQVNASLDAWLAQLQGSLSPSACGRVACEQVGTSTDCSIAVAWDASRVSGGRIQRENEDAPAEGEENQQTLEIRTRL